jgi:hypothetical protein
MKSYCESLPLSQVHLKKDFLFCFFKIVLLSFELVYINNMRGFHCGNS